MISSFVKLISSHVRNFVSSLEDGNGSLISPVRKAAGYQLFNRIIGSALPFAQRNHFAVVEVKRGYVRSKISLRGNKNHIGTMYAGALFTLAEIPGGVLVLLAFESEYIPILKKLEIEFLKAARTDIEAEFSLSDELITSLEEQLSQTGKAEFSLQGRLTDEHGEVVAQSNANYVIRKR